MITPSPSFKVNNRLGRDSCQNVVIEEQVDDGDSAMFVGPCGVAVVVGEIEF